MDNPGTVRREHGILTGMHLPDGPEDLGLVTTTTALCPRADGGLGLTAVSYTHLTLPTNREV